MSAAAHDAESGREEGFTCSALLMCLYLPGLTKKKPDTTSPPTAEKAPAPDRPAEQQDAPSRAASLEKLSECVSPLYSRNNIVFDFVVAEEGEDQAAASAAQTMAIHGYCPSPCFDLPAELISRAGERFGVVETADSEATTPVLATATFVFDDDDGQRGGGALKKMASCLAAPGVEGKSESRLPNLVRFLSASSGRSSVPRPLVSRDAFL